MKNALVTGANKGIGYEICRQLARAGWQVFLSARSPERGNAAAALLRKELPGAAVEFLPLDASSVASIDAAVAVLDGRLTALDALVNNAAIFEGEDRSILNVELDELRRTFETNTFGPLYLTQKCRHLLAKAPDGGRVINLSSGLGQLQDMEDQYPSYSISKTALNAVSRQLASALKGDRIAVNAVSPGWVRTDMGGANADRSVEEGAAGTVWLATEAPLSLTGRFLRDHDEIPW